MVMDAWSLRGMMVEKDVVDLMGVVLADRERQEYHRPR
jgi:hypothetical protein